MMLFSRGYKRYVLATLTLVYTLNSLDVPLVNLLVEPIKSELHLSDVQIGFLTGMAFALFYATLGLPVARWVDRGNRVTIASIAVALWGVTVMGCVLVTTFLQLVLARIVAGIGGAGCMPPTYSLLGDYYPQPGERTRAMAIYMLSSPLAPLVSFILGGWLNDHYGWRAAFFTIGVPGLAFALLLKLSIKEPRSAALTAQLTARPAPRTLEVLSRLWCQRAARHLTCGTVLFFTIGLGLAPWLAAFMMRSHGMATVELGLWLGLIWGLGGMAGVLLGGYIGERCFTGNERGQMRLVALVIAALLPCYALVLFLPDKRESLLAMIPLVMVGNFIFGPIFALMQRLVVDEMRATTVAVVMLLANLIGMGLGPQSVGLMSDLLMPVLGTDSLRYAMLILSCLALWAAWHFWKVSQTVMADLEDTARCATASAKRHQRMTDIALSEQ